MSKEKGKSMSDKQPAAEPRKGKVYTYVSTSKGLVPWEQLRRFEMKKKSAEDRSKSSQVKSLKLYMTDKGLVPLPFAVDGLLTLLENCSFFDACVRQIAKDVCGQGWSLRLREGKKQENEAKKKEIQARFEDPNTDEDSLEDVLERMIIDWGAIGWMALEVVPEGEEVTGLYHVPAHSLRVHKDGNKYCQVRNNIYVWFKRFGYEGDVNVDDGSEENVPEDKQAHELLFYRNYYAQSSWYGAPNILPSVGAVKALIGIRDYNLAFFENYGVPAAIVTLTGDWDEEGIKGISDFIDVEIKGSQNQHKTIVLNPPEGGEVKWEPLVIEIKEGHFKLYFKNLRDEVLVCYKMPPYRIGIAEVGSLGGSTAAESTRIYIDSIVNPLKRVVEHLMTQKVIRDGFGCEDYVFKLGELDTRDMTALVNRYELLFKMGTVTRAHIAEALALPPIPDADPYRLTYFISTAYVEVGAEPMAEGAAVQQSAVEELKRDVDKAITESRKAQVNNIKPEED